MLRYSVARAQRQMRMYAVGCTSSEDIKARVAARVGYRAGTRWGSIQGWPAQEVFQDRVVTRAMPSGAGKSAVQGKQQVACRTVEFGAGLVVVVGEVFFGVQADPGVGGAARGRRCRG